MGFCLGLAWACFRMISHGFGIVVEIFVGGARYEGSL